MLAAAHCTVGEVCMQVGFENIGNWFSMTKPKEH
jgi:hypothetical protein